MPRRTMCAQRCAAPWLSPENAAAMKLVTDPNLESPDDFYAALIDAHRDLTAKQSHELNARLVLLLANHIGAQGVLREALDAARGDRDG